MTQMTRRVSLLNLALVFVVPAASTAQPAPGVSKRVYVEKMFGLEAYVEKALKDKELPFEFIEETRQPELKATLKKKTSNFYGQILYREKFGRDEDHSLELYDIDKEKVVASYSFKLVAGSAGLERIAQEFANRVTAALKGRR